VDPVTASRRPSFVVGRSAHQGTVGDSCKSGAELLLPQVTLALFSPPRQVYNASLVHDDLQDRDTTGVGLTVWMAFDGVAVLCRRRFAIGVLRLAAIQPYAPATSLMTLLHHRIADATTGCVLDLCSTKPTNVF
jgi:hypothetical protein